MNYKTTCVNITQFSFVIIIFLWCSPKKTLYTSIWLKFEMEKPSYSGLFILTLVFLNCYQSLWKRFNCIIIWCWYKTIFFPLLVTSLISQCFLTFYIVSSYTNFSIRLKKSFLKSLFAFFSKLIFISICRYIPVFFLCFSCFKPWFGTCFIFLLQTA